ncbi:MAG: hypothetical protein ACK2UL_05585, partial [Anaerolineae bacterium]
WAETLAHLAASQEATAAILAAVAEARSVAAARSSELRTAEDESENVDEALVTMRLGRDELTAKMSEINQSAAVNRARLDALRRRLGEMATADDVEVEALSSRSARVAEIEADVERLTAAHERRRAAADEAARLLADGEAERDRHAIGIESAQAALLELKSSLAAEMHRIESAERAIKDRREEMSTATAARDDAAAALDRHAAELARASSAVDAAEAERAALAERVAAADAEMRAVAERLAEAQAEHTAARARLEALRARSEALESHFGDLDAALAVTNVLAEAGDVAVVGSVAELIEMDGEWQAAVAAALGDLVHAVVVRDESDVDGALSVVRDRGPAGLTLAPIVADAAGHRPWTSEPGDIRASDVARAPDAEGLVEVLLGGTVLTPDLASARAALRRASPPARAVTRSGQLVLPRGVVTVGTKAEETLRVQAERRELPGSIDGAARAVDRLAEAMESAADRRRELESELGELASERLERDEAYRAAADELAAQQAAGARAERERDWYAETADRLAREVLTLESQIAQGRRSLAEREPEEDRLAEELRDARERLEAADLTAAREAAAVAAAEASAAAQQLAGRQAMLDAARRDLAEAYERHAAEQMRGAAIAEEMEQLQADAERLAVESRDVNQRLEDLEKSLAPAEAAARHARTGLHGLLSAVSEARDALSAVESRLVDARVSETRAGDRLERLAEQLRVDAEAVGWDDVPVAAAETADRLVAIDLGLPRVTELPDGIEEDIAVMRRRLRAIGAIDREALATYRETRERHAHLEEQRADLEGAREDVTEVLDALAAEMAQRFDQTFGLVAEAFAGFFPQLFGGGEAELVLRRGGESEEDAEQSDESERRESGIDIVARPPGKRRQPLELLSGGERSLTAVALIFALLRVSGTPFVVLDEVDAALDEANVGRFRDALQALASDTQVVIITHNRGTIQAADTVYGVTMQDDGASQVISLQVDADE